MLLQPRLHCIMRPPCNSAGSPARTVGWRDQGFIHTSFLKNLWPNSVYVFSCIFLTQKYSEVLMIYVDRCYNGISGTLTEWVISYPMVQLPGAKAILSNHPHILDRTPYNV